MGKRQGVRPEHVIPRNSSLPLVESNAISDRREIAGNGFPAGCTDFSCTHAYVLILCDENHSDEEGCEEGAESTTAIQNNPVPIALNPTDRTGVGLTPREIADQIRARFGRNRGLGPW